METAAKFMSKTLMYCSRACLTVESHELHTSFMSRECVYLVTASINEHMEVFIIP